MAADPDKPVVLSRIYTRTGDDGTTALGDMSRARKTDARLAAYADTDEANSAIGVAVTMGQLPADISALLVRIQNELFDVGADLCNPVSAQPEFPPLRVEPDYIDRLEQACDEYNAGLPVLRSFVLPGGTPAAPCCTWPGPSCAGPSAAPGPRWRSTPTRMNPLTAQYLNRLSDLLFILARKVNEHGGDLLWKPGGERA